MTLYHIIRKSDGAVYGYHHGLHSVGFDDTVQAVKMSAAVAAKLIGDRTDVEVREAV